MSQGPPLFIVRRPRWGWGVVVPTLGEGFLGWAGDKALQSGESLGWEQRNWINSADPGDWEINHVFKKTGPFLVHFPFSFGEQREGLLMEGAGGGHELGLFHT